MSRTLVPSAHRPAELVAVDVADHVLDGNDERSRHVADEVLDVLVGGLDHHGLRRADLHEATVAHDRDAITKTQRLGQVVGDEDHRLVDLATQPDDLVLHVAADQRVERRERLVEQQDVGIGGQCSGEPDALLLSAAELVRAIAAHLRQARRVPASRWPCGAAPPCRRRAPRDRTRRCRSAFGVAADRSVGTPSTPCCGARRAACRGRPWSRRRRRSAPCRRSVRSAG